MFTFGLAEGPMAFDPLILLLLAMVLEGAAGFAIRVFKLFPSLLDVVKGLIRFLTVS